ncbi:hypothetical protein GCM10009710_30940 [Aeromicrobium alkaliterrae]|uniref:DUF732 domain-containing protein n=1 Tax=Aeromicrobium alkaliterrae TaxID=302168 RepID=A0ABN2K5D2_9ACTN
MGTLAVFGLAACGGDDDTSNNDSESSSQSDEPTDEPTEDSSEGDGDKPAKEDVVAGYTKIITDITGQLPEDIVTQVASCFVDEVYDAASAQTLQAIADSNPAGIDQSDGQLFADASTTCQSQLTP